MLTPYFRPSLPSLGTLWLPSINISERSTYFHARQVTLVDVAFNHDTRDGGLSGCNLFGDAMRNLDLVLVFLLRIAVATIDHQTRVEILRFQLLARLFDAGRVVVGALLATAHDHKSIVVASGTDNGDYTRFGDGEEVMGVLHGAQRVNGNIQSAVSTIFEAYRER